jgi:hypothetical protein
MLPATSAKTVPEPLAGELAAATYARDTAFVVVKYRLIVGASGII